MQEGLSFYHYPYLLSIIIYLLSLSIIAAVRADFEEGIALGSSGGFPSGPGGFLGFSACSRGQGTLACPGCSIHAANS